MTKRESPKPEKAKSKDELSRKALVDDYDTKIAELTKQHEDLKDQVEQGRQTLKQMEQSLLNLTGRIQAVQILRNELEPFETTKE